jgi:murein DD-endopeptidase MepM/ murein hydrolase activator NlpD
MSAALLLTLAACNQSGRPAPQPYVGPDQAALNAQMGQVVDGAYVVAPGDTLAVVSERTNTPIRSLIDLNNLQPPYLIVAGQRLALHQRSHYVVQSGDTVSRLSKKLGVTQSALIQLNNLKAPYALKIGQTLNLPSQIEASNDPASTPAAAPSGSVSQAALPPLPGASSPTEPAAAATLPTPAATTAGTGKPQAGAKPLADPNSPAAPAAEPEPIEPSVTSMPAAQPLPSPQPPATPPAATPPAATPPAASPPAATQTAAATAPVPPPAAPAKPATTVMKPTGSGKFGWPVQGKVIGKFGGGTDGLKNDGINIAAPVGAPVNAAADGVVAYAGNQLRGFGNMILIRHADGYVTAYAHNQSLLVEKGAKVKRGQTIARVGSTGNVGSPQLHFEIRKGTEPVDPLTLLGG